MQGANGHPQVCTIVLWRVGGGRCPRLNYGCGVIGHGDEMCGAGQCMAASGTSKAAHIMRAALVSADDLNLQGNEELLTGTCNFSAA